MTLVWTLRGLWLATAFLAWDGIADVLGDRSDPVQVVIATLLLASWFVGAVALLAPSTVSLTVLRVIIPAGPLVLGALLWSGSPTNAQIVGALVPSVVAAGISLLAPTGDVMVNGSAYGPERRMALRPPSALLLGPVLLTWIAVIAGLAAGPLLLAARNWVLGGLAIVLSAVIVPIGLRSLHQLSRRWIVFVPAGFVIHDYLALGESILLRRAAIEALGPAPSQLVGAADLSAGALGLALQVTAVEPVPLTLRDRRSLVTIEAIRLVFTPSLPGRLLHEARVRGITIQ